MTCKLGVIFVDKSKDFYVENLVRVAAEEQNGLGLWEFAGKSGSDSTKIHH